jgi:prolyl-tRNA editing enzyme YbaK/EbsC (Cys-tRNA(Pro) deacylase)
MIDEALMAFGDIWAAAGTPRLVVEFAVGDHTLETVPLFDEFAAN